MKKLLLLLFLTIPLFSYELDESFYAFLTRFEGISYTVYNDAMVPVIKAKKGGFLKPDKGFLHIGIGHKLTEQEIVSGIIEINGLKFDICNKPLPKEQVYQLLNQDLKYFKNLIRRFVKRKLLKHEYYSLLSMTFNVGHATFLNGSKPNKLLISLNNNNNHQVYMEMQKFITVKGKVLKGLVKRRLAEGRLFLKGF